MTAQQQQHAQKRGNIITMKDAWKPNCKQIIVEEVMNLGDGVMVKHVWGELFFNSMADYMEAIDWEWMKGVGVV
jgi:hypothetical protein